MATSTARSPVRPSGSPPRSGLVLAGDRSAAVVAFEGEMVDFFVSAAEMLGVPKSVAAIYGIIFASPVPLRFADIEARLDFSKGSVSQGIRVLREVGAIKEVSSEQDRAECFVPDLEMRKLIGRFLENRLMQQLDAGGNQLAALGKQIPADEAHNAAVLRQRLNSLQDWHRKARALLPVARTFLKLGGR